MDPCNCTVTYLVGFSGGIDMGAAVFLGLAGLALVAWTLAGPDRAVAARMGK